MIEKLSILVTQELVELGAAPMRPWWIAQVIEQDLATQAQTLNELVAEVRRLVAAHILFCAEDGDAPFQGPLAPDDQRLKFEAAVTRLEPIMDAETTPGIELPILDFRIIV